MKTSFAFLALGAGLAVAQDLSSLPQCGQTCISNMLAIANSQFGCSNGDIACYCNTPSFGYGVRDCSNEACPNAADANAVIAFGNAYCANFMATATVASTVSNSAGAILSSALETFGPSVSGSDGEVQSTAISTSALVATVVSGDSTFLQTTGFSTIFGVPSGVTESGGSAIASATDSAGSVIASATDSAGSVIASATDSAGSALSSATESAGSALSSATDSLGSVISSAT
ncbi:CFEM-domain-containing protein [Lojkania enalia]|uniref:CFEM-domain-containing protein n=1 Tax=Lojkania enalia TaxID=147567 RepID=A0A9P4N297_9PLEO|nr:CFEM-domain-containing protein [Didymosphaeria enalia]